VTANISLAAATKYALRLEFQNNAGLNQGQGIQLTWKSPSMADYELIPQSQLFEPTTNDAPIAQAGPDQNVTLPAGATVSLSAFGSSDPDGTITTYAWSNVSGPNTPTFSAGSSQNTDVSTLIAGTYVFRVTVTDNGSLTDTDDVTVVVNAANVLPTVDAGPNQTITLPTSSANLNSNGGADSDGTIADITWTQASGPVTAIISNDDIDDPTVSGMTTPGLYTFTATVTDDDGGTGFDQVQITVNAAAANQAPVASVLTGNNIYVYVTPSDIVNLEGRASDPDGIIISTQWIFISGPNTPSIGTPAALETPLTGLIPGVYVIRFRATDNGVDEGLSATDDITITVLQSTQRVIRQTILFKAN
jgi:hypothetical protein